MFPPSCHSFHLTSPHLARISCVLVIALALSQRSPPFRSPTGRSYLRDANRITIYPNSDVTLDRVYGSVTAAVDLEFPREHRDDGLDNAMCDGGRGSETVVRLQ